MQKIRAMQQENIEVLLIGVVNLNLVSKVPVKFRNLRSYDSHLIMEETGKCDVKVNVIPNGLEKKRLLELTTI